VRVCVCGWQGDRADVPDVIVLITDESSSTGSAETVNEAAETQSADIAIYAIGTDRPGFNLTELQLIASPPRLQYRQWWAPSDLRAGSLDNIEVMIDNELCRTEYGPSNCSSLRHLSLFSRTSRQYVDPPDFR